MDRRVRIIEGEGTEIEDRVNEFLASLSPTARSRAKITHTAVFWESESAVLHTFVIDYEVP